MIKLSRNEQYLDYICKNGGLRNINANIKFNEYRANDISIPASMLAAISSIFTGCGITISSDDDIYDIAYVFYNKYKDNWENVKNIFNTCVSISSNSVISIGEEFLEIVKECFDFYFLPLNSSTANNLVISSGLPYVGNRTFSSSFSTIAYNRGFKRVITTDDFCVGSYDFKFLRMTDEESAWFDIYLNGSNVSYIGSLKVGVEYSFAASVYGNEPLILYTTFNGSTYNCNHTGVTVDNSISIPYIPGSYNWSEVENRKENNSVLLPVPVNLGNLVGQAASEFWLNKNDLVGKNNISVPVIDNPSIAICEPYSFSSTSNDEGGQENILPMPQSRIEKLLYAMATGDNSNIEPAKSRIEQYLHYILKE